MGKAPGLVHPSLLQVSTKQGIITALKRREPGVINPDGKVGVLSRVEVTPILIVIQVSLSYTKLIKRRIQKTATFIRLISFPDAVPPLLLLLLSRRYC
jgi:hypothetical protein